MRPKSNSERAARVAALLHEVSLHDDASELRHFAELCRTSLRVRVWLFSRFAAEKEIQRKFRAFLRDPDGPIEGLWSEPLEQEVRSQPPSTMPSGGPHGGLSAAEVVALIQRERVSRTDVMSLLLVRMWRNFVRTNRPAPPALWRATLDHWAAIVADGEGRLAHNLAEAVRFFDDDVSSSPEGSWKLHLLFHVLDHPKSCYRVSELIECLPERFRRERPDGSLYVEPRLVRIFCSEHGIRRDKRAGRPHSKH